MYCFWLRKTQYLCGFVPDYYNATPTKKSRSPERDFFIHCESNGISSTIAMLSLYLISPLGQYIITHSVYQKPFVMMICNPLRNC